MSQITTHILDTTSGKPAKDVKIILYQSLNQSWCEIATGITNSDGRISNLLSENKKLETGIYKMKFFTSEYFAKTNVATFYPFVEIVFDINNEEHYHIPLLLSPYGYTTYRGS